MPLDPQARSLLDQLEALGAPPLSQQTPEEARAGFAVLAAVAGPSEEPVPTEDRSVPGPAGDIPVRIYRPESDQPLPVVVYFHGGGWVIGDMFSPRLVPPWRTALPSDGRTPRPC
jgi:acetyl esterase